MMNAYPTFGLFLINTPFLLECFIIVGCIFYLCICCFAKHKWWNFGVDSYLRNKIFQFFIMFLLIEFFFLIFFNFLTFDLNFFDNFFNENYVTQFIKILIIFSSAFSFYWCCFFLTINSGKYTYITEFPFLFLGAFLFLLLLNATNDLLAMILCILGMSICLYSLLIANSVFGKIYREASVKYFIMSALSSGLILGGLKELYLWSGTLKLNLVNNFILLKFCENNATIEFLPFKIGIILIIFGFMFKISAAPSHFWAPEVYEGTPYAIVIFILLPVKIAIGSVLLRLIKTNFHIFGYGYNFAQKIWIDIEYIFIFIIILSLIIGAINSLFEYKIKRFLAYSSVNQIGFLLISFLDGFSLFSVQTFFYFLITYLINMVILFGVLLNIWKTQIILSTNTNLQKTENINLKYIWDLRSLYSFETLFSWQSILSCLCMFSLAGIPPLAGFFGKFYILIYAFQTKNWIVLFLGFLTSILGAFYYLRFIKILFFEKKKPINLKTQKIKKTTNNIFLTNTNIQNDTRYIWFFGFLIVCGFIYLDTWFLKITFLVAQNLYFLNY